MTTNGNGHVNGAKVPLRKIAESKQKPPKKKATSQSAPDPDINDQLNGRLGEFVAKAAARSMTKVVEPVAKTVRENRKATDEELNALRMEVSELKSRPTWFKVPVFILAFDKHMSAQEQKMIEAVDSMLHPAEPDDIDLTKALEEMEIEPEQEPLRLSPPVQQEPAPTNKETRTWLPLPKFLRRSQPHQD